MAPKCRLVSGSSNSKLLLFIPLLLNAIYTSAAPESEAEVLLRFRDSLNNTAALNGWKASTPLCDGIVSGSSSWAGILCDREMVSGIKLENMGLGGFIDVDALSQLDGLKTVSFMANNFQGTIPDFSKVIGLKRLYLAYNGFSGEIPVKAFAGMVSLTKLLLSLNKLTGEIPSELAKLPALEDLRLDRNQLEGEIPNFPLNTLKVLNVSQNKLEGEIPRTLRRFGPSSFSGNKELCGGPLPPCSSHGPNLSAIIVAAILVAAATAALIAVCIILVRRKKNTPETNPATAGPPAIATKVQPLQMPTASGVDVEQGRISTDSRLSVSSADPNKQSVKLSFLRDDGFEFDMTDLLKASAEALGSGSFGSSYKAALKPGKVVVVKRFKYMSNVAREDFSDHMRRLGQLNHERVLPIVAFYYRKEEKLLVTEYAVNFSLAAQLHGNSSRGRPSPDWPTRLSIIKGIASGLQYLYTSLPNLITPHGHLKSSNVLLDGSFRPLLTDYGLSPIVNQEHAPVHMLSYKCPEYKDSRRISRKTDIWSFGILILETLTGRAPSNLFQQGSESESESEVDLATWAESMIESGGDGGEVLFDKEMNSASDSEGEMMKLLKIGLSCCEADVEKRPDIGEVVEKLEEIKEKD